jgi:hypothetical protein
MDRDEEIRNLAQRGVAAVFDEESEFDTDRAYELATVLATWCFETASALTENGTEAEEAQITALTNAIMAAYFAGLLEGESTPTNPQGLTIPGKSGSIVNIYIS